MSDEFVMRRPASTHVENCGIAVVIVNFRTAALATRCIESLEIERRQLPNLRVIVVDGGSGDNSAMQLRKFADRPLFSAWVRVLPLEINGGFGWANNQAILRLLSDANAPDFIHLLNPDTEIEPGAIVALARDLLLNPGAAATGSQLLELDGETSGSAFRFPTIRGEFSRGAVTGLIDRLFSIEPVALPPVSESTEVDWVTGASVMLRTDALRQVGLFDDGFFLYHEEVELMWRLREGGWSVRHSPRSRVRHVGGASTGVHDRVDATARTPRRPAYWYQSRRRYFVRTRGTIAAGAATTLWLFGHLLWRARRILGLAHKSRPVVAELCDHLRHGLPRRSDSYGGPVAWNGPLDVPPAWMSRRHYD